MPTPTRSTRQPVRATPRQAGRPAAGAAARPPMRPIPGRATPPPPEPRFEPGTLRTIVVGALTLATIAAGYTAYRFLRDDGTGPQSGCAIGIDAQGATGVMRTNIESWLPQQITECADGGKGVVDVFLATAQTRTNITPAEATNFRNDIDLVGNNDVDARRVSEAVDALVDRVEDNILGAPRQTKVGTDLIGASCVAADMLKGRTSKTLVLFSDAVNGSKPYRLRYMDLDDASIKEAVDEAVSSGQLCRLDGVKVSMFGVGMSRVTDLMEPGRLEAIERFWRAAWAAVGAELVSYQREP